MAQFIYQRDCLIFRFTPECRLPEKRRYIHALVDRIFNDIIYRNSEFREAQIARLDGIKRKHIVFTSACLRARRCRARVINVGCLPSSVKNNVANSDKRITCLQIKSEIPLACSRKRYGDTREFLNVSDSELPIYYIEGIRITSQAFILLKTHSDSQQFTHIVTTTEIATRATSKSRKF